MISKYKTLLLILLYITLVLTLGEIFYLASEEFIHKPTYDIILDASAYNDSHFATIWEQLAHRMKAQPFNLPSLIIFACAIIHTLFSHQFNLLSDSLRNRNIKQNKEIIDSFGVEILRFMGEVEVIFGIWVIPLAMVMSLYYDWSTTIGYLSSRTYTEPLFVIVIMAVSSTKPIVKLAETALKCIAQIGRETVASWWWTILTIGPIAGSFITEPGAMTLSCLMLSHHFYRYKPQPKFAYATLGLLFTNISVGGVLTSFAATPVLMISQKWGWSTLFMIKNFGWKVVIGILIANVIYYSFFKSELQRMELLRREELSQQNNEGDKVKMIPFWITFTHIVFLAWMVLHSHYPVIFLGSFLLFLGFQRATHPFQTEMELRMPILVGYFLAGLIVHGSLQGWWISALLGNANEQILMILSATLTAFTDNAQITFLASLIPSFTDPMKYAIVAGAVTGGGLTVIANAPNPLGQALLSKHFFQGISMGALFLAAITPTLVMAAAFLAL